MMAAVRSKHTKPERFIRRELHSRGYRFRLHRPDLPSKPDIVFPARKRAIFVNGCFRHGHDCSRGAFPATRHELWAAKIGGNTARDAENQRKLEANGWSVLVVWACDLRQPQAGRTYHFFAGCRTATGGYGALSVPTRPIPIVGLFSVAGGIYERMQALSALEVFSTADRTTAPDAGQRTE